MRRISAAFFSDMVCVGLHRICCGAKSVDVDKDPIMRPSRFALVTAPFALAMLAAPLAVLPASPARAQFGIGVSITIAPPPLPVYEQPPLPAPGYLWTPGFWNYASDGGYYWVPGTWVEPPAVGLLWTPGYWGFDNGYYVFNRGYWGPHVGFYGGINYGFGYGGVGFQGGEWRGGAFAYNRAVNNFGGVHVTNVYSRTVINNTTINRVSFNGPNGIAARPSAEEASFARERHVQATELQQQHERAAAQNPEFRATVNRGNPAIAATARPGEFHGPSATQPRPVATPQLRPGEPAKTNEPARPTSGANPTHTVHGPAPRPAGIDAHPALRGPSSPVTHGPAMPQQRFNVTRPANAPHMAPPPPQHPAPAPAPHPAGGNGHPEEHRPH